MNKQQSKTRKYAVAYMRYSSDNQNENSIEYQRARIKTYCFQNNICLLHEYIDRAQTGTTDRRPAFQCMMDDAQNHPKWTMVLVFDFSRFSRNSLNAGKYKNLLKDNDIDLISVTQELEDTPEGRLMEQIFFIMDGFSSEKNAVHTHAGMLEKAKQANHCGGIPPLGYDVDANKHLVINQEEADTVRKIFDMYENNYSYSAMARKLNAEGRKTKAGKPFNKNSFTSILRQEKYIGVFSWNKTRQKKSDGSRNSHKEKPVEEQIMVVGGCPPIINEEQFERVQRLFASRVNGMATSKRRHHYMLSGMGILRCAHCGEYLIGTTRKSHGRVYTTYYCPKHKNDGNQGCPTKEISAPCLDKMVAGLIVRDMYYRKDIARLNMALSQNEYYGKLMQKKYGVENAIANVMKGIEQGGSDILLGRLNSLMEEKHELEVKVSDYKEVLIPEDKKERGHICNQFGKYLMSSDDLEVKLYLKQTIQEIVVGNDDVEIKLNIA